MVTFRSRKGSAQRSLGNTGRPLYDFLHFSVAIIALQAYNCLLFCDDIDILVYVVKKFCHSLDCSPLYEHLTKEFSHNDHFLNKALLYSSAPSSKSRNMCCLLFISCDFKIVLTELSTQTLYSDNFLTQFWYND